MPKRPKPRIVVADGRARRVRGLSRDDMLKALGEDPCAVMKHFYLEKKMRAAGTRDLRELVWWMGKTYDPHFPETVDDVLRPHRRPKK
jgi:hypothetical protein